MIAPAVGLLLLAAGVLLRGGETTEPQLPARPQAPGAEAGPVQAAPPPAPAPALAPANDVARAVENDRVLGTYRNYRAAVATKNGALQKSLHPILVRDRELALRMARQDLDRARDPQDRDIAQRTLEALRR